MRNILVFLLGFAAGWFLVQAWQKRQEQLELQGAHRDAMRLRRQWEPQAQPAPSQGPARPAQSTTTPAAPAPAEPAPEPDDLTQVRGIGKVFQERLREAGVLSYSQLAQANPDRLREIVQAADWQRVEPELWVQEAAILAAE